MDDLAKVLVRLLFVADVDLSTLKPDDAGRSGGGGGSGDAEMLKETAEAAAHREQLERLKGRRTSGAVFASMFKSAEQKVKEDEEYASSVSLMREKGRLKYLDELFAVWDADGSGFLEGVEITSVIAKYNAAVRVSDEDKTQASYMLEVADIDKDGKMSRDEFPRFFLQLCDGFEDDETFDLVLENLHNAVEMVFREDAACETWNDLVEEGQQIPREDLRKVFQYFVLHKLQDCGLATAEQREAIAEKIVMPDEIHPNDPAHDGESEGEDGGGGGSKKKGGGAGDAAAAENAASGGDAAETAAAAAAAAAAEGGDNKSGAGADEADLNKAALLIQRNLRFKQEQEKRKDLILTGLLDIFDPTDKEFFQPVDRYRFAACCARVLSFDFHQNSRPQFIEMLGSLGESMVEWGQHARLDAVFGNWDANGSGFLEKNEIDAVLERLENAYDVIYDTGEHDDHPMDGTAAGAAATPASGEKATDGANGDDQGKAEPEEKKVSPEDAAAAAAAEKKASWIIEKANKAMEVSDRNHDGKLERSEFTKYILGLCHGFSHNGFANFLDYVDRIVLELKRIPTVNTIFEEFHAALGGGGAAGSGAGAAQQEVTMEAMEAVFKKARGDIAIDLSYLEENPYTVIDQRDFVELTIELTNALNEDEFDAFTVSDGWMAASLAFRGDQRGLPLVCVRARACVCV